MSMMTPLEKVLRTPTHDRAFSLSFFRYFRAFTHYKLFFLSVLLLSVAKRTESTRFLFHQNYRQWQMLYTNYYGCCRQFQTTIKTIRFPIWRVLI